jgi:hypothetical protein
MYTPTRGASSSSIVNPASVIAKWADAMARWMKGSIRLISFRSIKSSGTNPLTSAAIVVEKSDGSNFVIRPTPDLPARIASQVEPTPIPSGVTAPSPVTTTLRIRTSR